MENHTIYDISRQDDEPQGDNFFGIPNKPGKCKSGIYATISSAKKGMVAAVHLSCRRWTCSACAERLRLDYANRIYRHCKTDAGLGRNLFTERVPLNQWENRARVFRYSDVHYCAIGAQPDGTVFVAGSYKSERGQAHASPESLMEEVGKAINAITVPSGREPGKRFRPVNFSRDWPAPEDDSDWKIEGPLRQEARTPAGAAALIFRCGVEAHEMTPVGWCNWGTYSTPPALLRQAVISALTLGKNMPSPYVSPANVDPPGKPEIPPREECPLARGPLEG